MQPYVFGLYLIRVDIDNVDNFTDLSLSLCLTRSPSQSLISRLICLTRLSISSYTQPISFFSAYIMPHTQLSASGKPMSTSFAVLAIQFTLLYKNINSRFSSSFPSTFHVFSLKFSLFHFILFFTCSFLCVLYFQHSLISPCSKRKP